MWTKKMTRDELPTGPAAAAPRIEYVDQVQTSDRAVDVSEARKAASDPKHRAIERWEDEGGTPLIIYSRQVCDAPRRHDTREVEPSYADSVVGHPVVDAKAVRLARSSRRGVSKVSNPTLLDRSSDDIRK